MSGVDEGKTMEQVIGESLDYLHHSAQMRWLEAGVPNEHIETRGRYDDACKALRMLVFERNAARAVAEEQQTRADIADRTITKIGEAIEHARVLVL